MNASNIPLLVDNMNLKALDKLQLNFLEAATEPLDVAIPAWERLSSVNFQRLESALNMILAAIYWNLKQYVPYETNFITCASVYRYHLARNHQIAYELRKVIDDLSRADIPICFLSDAALVFHYFESYGARALNQIEWLVPSQHLTTAKRLVSSHPIRGAVITLHDQPMDEHFSRHFKEEDWENCVPCDSLNGAVSVLSPTKQLLNILVPTHENYSTSLIQMMIDAMTLLKSTNYEIDWESLSSYFRLEDRTRQAKQVFQYLLAQSPPQ